MPEPLEAVYPCHWHRVWGQTGGAPLSEHKAGALCALWGGPSHSAHSGGRLTHVGHSSCTEQSRVDPSRRKWLWKHSDKGGANGPDASGQPLLHRLLPVILFPSLANPFLFSVPRQRNVNCHLLNFYCVYMLLCVPVACWGWLRQVYKSPCSISRNCVRQLLNIAIIKN